MLNRKNTVVAFSIFFCVLALAGGAYPADESVLFTSVSPDALIALDLSASMLSTPFGQYLYTDTSAHCSGSSVPHYGTSGSGHTNRCDMGITNPDGVKWGDSACAGPFYSASGTGHTTDCSRLAIAKTAIFSMLDDTNNGTINSTGSSTDDSSLNVRLGYMNFYNCGSSDDTGGSTSSGCITLVNAIGTKYSSIYCANSTSCSATGSGGIRGATTAGYTPLGSMLREAKLYLDTHKAADSAAACRDKFAILITDGADTISCQTNSDIEWDAIQYKRRRVTVDRAKALAAAGYKVFVVGFGADMPFYLRNTLNWAAYHGGTDNPAVVNTGNTGAYTPYAATSDVANPTACSTTTATTCYKYDCSSGTGLNCPTPTLTSCTAGTDNCYCAATSNDPGGLPVSVTGGALDVTGALDGYAFIATNPDELTTALKQAINIIKAAVYSFSSTSVSSARITSENNIYEASLQPIDDEPFWMGRLKKFAINSDGSVGSVVWEAGNVLSTTAASSRNIMTYKSGGLTSFLTSNITPQDLGLASSETARRDEVVGYFRGETAYNEDNWKLGDVWHSNPIVLTSPSPYFTDKIDTGSTNGFAAFRTANQRTSDNGKRTIVVGGNDGQFHAFRASDGVETFSFIPPNLLPKLSLVAHSTHPTALTHQYFVDGPTSAADVWLYPGSSSDGTAKSSGDWKTLVVFGEGRGAGSYLWSASSDCTPTTAGDMGYSQYYSSSYPNYCGYYAFDFTNTASPAYKWRVNGLTSANAPYLNAPWSKMSLGRVKIDGKERWVGFLGGGGFEYSCGGGQPSEPATAGKGFYVIDLSNGTVLWSYTKATNSLMEYSIPAPPALVDTDNDGFIDAVYIGDLGGNMWRFRLCPANMTTCTTANWTGGLFYQSSSGNIRPIYTGAVLSVDASSNLWVYWGSGDKQCPAAANAQERFYAVKDNPVRCSSASDCPSGSTCSTGRCTITYGFNSLDNLTSAAQTYGGTRQGWAMNLAGSGEKMLGEPPTIFNGVVYFSTYTPASGGDACTQGGSGKLYGVGYTSGGGALAGAARSITLGAGIPSSPEISLRPDGTGADMYITNSGGGGTDAQTVKVDGANLGFPSNRSNILYWKDRRVQ